MIDWLAVIVICVNGECAFWADTKVPYETKAACEAQVVEMSRYFGEKAGQVRSQRNDLLTASDWTQGKDIPDSVSTPWATYRQALRDIPEQSGFPWNVTWPVSPRV